MKITVFIKNTVVLVATSLILRLSGIVFRIYLADKIGSEGIGLYQLIFSVYIFAATFASSGVCTAVTRLVAENLNNGRAAVRRVMRNATLITICVAFASWCAVFFGAEFIAKTLLQDARATISLKILSFSLPFMGLSSCARGYFIACRKTFQPSLVQIAEQLIRITVICILLSLYATKGLQYCTAAVLFGDTVAETASFIINWLLYLKDVKKIKIGAKTHQFYKKIFNIALPITATGYLSTALHTIENLLVPSRMSLDNGSRERSLELFGSIRGMALPILFFPASFLTSLSTMLMPEVSEAAALGNTQKIRSTVGRSVYITLSLSIFVASVFMFNAEDIGLIIYKSKDVGEIIKILSPIIPFMYLESVAAGMLKGLDKQVSMFKYNCIDSCLRIAAVFFLLPHFGVKGYLGIMLISNTLTSTLNSRKLLKTAQIKIDYVNYIFKPLCVSLSGGFLSYIIAKNIPILLLRCIVSIIIQLFIFSIFALPYLKTKKELL